MTVNEKVLEYIKKYKMIPRGSSVIVGLSGGADSVCLLFLLYEFKTVLDFSLKAVHVEHGIRGEEAIEDKEFCERLCESLNIELEVFRVDVPGLAKEKGLTLEEAGRIARYEIFEKINADRVAVAHHGMDQAETVLFNLFRGSAVAGIGGMKPVRDKIIRPLLCLTRPEIEVFLSDNKIDYRTDSTNFDNDISRNRIRHGIIPLAEKINKRAVKHINETAEYMREVEAFVKDEAGKRAEKYILKQGNAVYLKLEGFKEENNIIQDYVIRECIKLSAGRLKDITSRHVLSVRELLENTSGKRTELPYDTAVIKSFDRLEFVKRAVMHGKTAEYNEINIAVPDEGCVILPNGEEYKFSFEEHLSMEQVTKGHRYTKWFDYDKILQKPCIRHRQPGDMISIKNGSKKIKDLFIEEKIPYGERDSIFMLCDGNEVVWIPDYRIGEKYKVSENTKTIWKVEKRDNGGEN